MEEAQKILIQIRDLVILGLVLIVANITVPDEAKHKSAIKNWMIRKNLHEYIKTYNRKHEKLRKKLRTGTDTGSAVVGLQALQNSLTPGKKLLKGILSR